MWIRYVVGLSEFYHQKICKSISQSSPKLWPKRCFVHTRSLINSSPCMRDASCKRKLKYVHWFLRYVGNKQTNRQTDRYRQKHYLPPEGRRATTSIIFVINLYKSTLRESLSLDKLSMLVWKGFAVTINMKEMLVLNGFIKAV